MSRRGCGCCQEDTCKQCDCFCNPDNPNLKEGELCSSVEADPPRSYSERRELFGLYDFTMLICNSNSVRDDEWEIKLNGYDFGKVVELGEDRCKGKFFSTSEVMLNKIKTAVMSDSSKDVDVSAGVYCDHTSLCCMRNTFDESDHKIVDRQAFNFCGDNPIQFKRYKANFNGNFGRIIIFRTGPSEGHFDYYSHLFTPEEECEGSVKPDEHGVLRKWVNKNTTICTEHVGTYSIPSVPTWEDEEGGVGLVYQPTVSQQCCFCNHPTRDIETDYRYGGPVI